MDTPTSGKVVVDGDDISGYKEAQLTEYRAGKIGFVFQFYNLIPNLNVVENVDFGIEVKKDTFDSTEVLKKVKMDKRLKAFPVDSFGRRAAESGDRESNSQKAEDPALMTSRQVRSITKTASRCSR